MGGLTVTISSVSLLASAYGGHAFLEDGKEYVYEAETYQNAGTMDYSPSAAAIGWRHRIRMQVAGDKINFPHKEPQIKL